CFVERCIVTAATLWALFSGLAEGLSVERAAEKSFFPHTLRSTYRTATALKRSALSWRSWLSVTSSAPTTASSRPLKQLRAHLTLVLGLTPFEDCNFRHACQLL